MSKDTTARMIARLRAFGIKPEGLIRNAADRLCAQDRQIRKLQRENAALQRRIDAASEHAQRLWDWQESYPMDIFPEPTTEQFGAAHQALKGAGLTLDVFSASAMRHLLKRCREISEAIKEALQK